MHISTSLKDFRSVRKISLVSVVALLLVGGILVKMASAATPTFKQAKAKEITSGVTDGVAFASANTAGDAIVVSLVWSNTGAVNVTDSRGNTYTPATTRTTWGSNWSAQVFYAKNVVAGTNTVTATFATSITSFGIVQAHEYSGIDKVNPLDGVAVSTGTGTSMSTGNVTTTAANDLLFDAGGSAGNMNTAPSGWTGRLNTSGNRSADKTAATVGSYNATNSNSGGAWVLQLVALRADTGVDTTAPTAPASLTATAASSAQVNLSWTAATDNVGVTGYQVERCQGTSCTNFAQVTTTASNVLTYSDTGLTASTLYRYRVRAVDAAGNLGAYSPIAQATTQGVPDTTAPSVPTGVSGTATSVSQINLTWTASTDNVAVTGYKIYRNGTQVGTSATTAYSDTGLTVNTSYNYTVSAYDAASNNSAQSSPAVAVSTLADTAAPTVPANVTLQVMSSTQITVSWSTSTDNVGVTGYHLYRCTGSGCTNFALINTVTVTPVQDPGLTPATTYNYVVSAFDAAGNESAQSTPVQASTPAPDNTPPAISMTAPANGSTVSGTVTVSANASDAGSGVHDVQFFVEGNPMSDDTTSPYSFQWNTTTTANGVYHLTAVAKDNAGNISNTSGAFTVTVSNPTTPQLPADLEGGWNFNEGTGMTTADVTAYGNTATFGALGSPVWSTGKYGSGLKFGGLAQDYLTINDSPTVNITGSALTLSMWINPSTSAPGDQVVFGKFWNGTSNEPHYQYGLELSKSLVPSFYIGTTNNTMLGAAMGGSLAANQWSNLAIVYDGAHVSYYVNGTLISSSSMTGSIASRTGSTIRMGADIDSSQKFLGSLDDVRLYKRALTQAAVQTDQTTPLNPSGGGSGPTITITAPTNNQQVSNIFALTADASDATGVQFYVDGTAVGPEDTTVPYTANWDTRTATNGAHTVTARARDANGNVTVASPVTVNVSNSDSFINDILATGFNLPTAMKFLPDGRMLVAELGGKIKIVPAPYTTPSSTLFLDISGSVAHAGVQEGIFDFAFDPNFSINHYFYVFYSNANGRDRLSRFTANATLDGTVAGSEFVLYEDPQQIPSDEHHGGGIAFSNDGKIFFSTGEHFLGTPAQDLTSPWGKIHRINMDGSVPTDNPFYDGSGPHWDSVYALGFRNPYRIYYDAPTGNLYVGDVGGNEYNTAYEEVDLVKPGANYGWPNCEFGTCGNPAYTPALYAYSHLGRDAAITGGFVYHGNGLSGAFPAGFEGNYFFGDYAQNWIRRLTFDGSGNVSGMNYFEPQNDVLDGPYGDVVYLTEGPDGSLYYIDLGYSDTSGTFGTSKIRRIRYQQSNQSPTAVAGSDVTSGPTPLTVSFNSNGSSDPEGQPLIYSWDFGDGTPLSTAANPTHTYATAGVYTARLTVSDGVTSTFAPPLTISAGSAPVATTPVLSVLTPKLHDDWGIGSSPDSTRWNTTGPSQVSLNTFHQLQIKSTLSSGSYGVSSAAKYDLTGAEAMTQVVGAGNQSLSSFTAMPVVLTKDGSNQLSWQISGGNIIAKQTVAGTVTTLASAPYSPSMHKYLRIRETGGSIFWEYSTNTTSWTSLTSLSSLPFDVSQLTVEQKAATTQTEATTTSALFDDIVLGAPASSQTTFRASDVLTFSADATDADDGSLPDSAFTWTIDFLHGGDPADSGCGAGCHTHPGMTITGSRGGVFTIPSSGHDFSGVTRYRITLVVTDSNGLRDTKSVIIWPQKVNLTFNSAPQGVTLYLDGVAYTAPFAHDTLIGFQHTIEARNATVGNSTYTFASWSDGGAQTHVITVPAADASYTATYNVTTSSNGPVAAWAFNEGSGTTSADTTGHSNTATLVNGPTWVAGKHGTGLSFDGTNDYLSLANSSTLDISGANLSLSMWISPGSVSGDSTVLGKFWNATMTNPYYQYGLELSAGKPNFYVGTSGGLVGAAMTSALPLNQWSHLGIVFNGTQVQFYLNGALVNTASLNATITAHGQALRLGADANTQQFFKGLLDDVRVYNRVLTAAEITTDMNAGS
jgi:glucose/arabinose dehydrogenase/chitodextrinase